MRLEYVTAVKYLDGPRRIIIELNEGGKTYEMEISVSDTLEPDLVPMGGQYNATLVDFKKDITIQEASNWMKQTYNSCQFVIIPITKMPDTGMNMFHGPIQDEIKTSFHSQYWLLILLNPSQYISSGLPDRC